MSQRETPTQREMRRDDIGEVYFELLRIASRLDDAQKDRSLTKAGMRQKIDFAVRRLDKLSNHELFEDMVWVIPNEGDPYCYSSK